MSIALLTCVVMVLLLLLLQLVRPDGTASVKFFNGDTKDVLLDGTVQTPDECVCVCVCVCVSIDLSLDLSLPPSHLVLLHRVTWAWLCCCAGGVLLQRGGDNAHDETRWHRDL